MGCTITRPSHELESPGDVSPVVSSKGNKKDKNRRKEIGSTDQETVASGSGAISGKESEKVSGATSSQLVQPGGPRIVSQLDLDLEKVELIEDTVRDNLALLKGAAYNPDDELIINNQNCEDLRAAARASNIRTNASNAPTRQNSDQRRFLGKDGGNSTSMYSMNSMSSHNNSNNNISGTATPQKSARAYRNVYVGLKLMCRDEFQSKYTKKLMHRWREIEVIEVQGNDKSQLFVHFVGWANTFDSWIDLHKDTQKVAAPNILTKDEIECGKMLTDDQILATKEYLIYGEIRTHKQPPLSNTLSDIGKSSGSSIHKEKELKAMHSEKSMQSSGSEGEILDSFFVGMKLDVLDVYYKRGSDKPHHKWREATVMTINGNKIKINYIGWDSKFDENLDVIKDKARIARHLSKSHRRSSSQSGDQSNSGNKHNDSDINSVISAKKTNSFLKKFDPDTFLKMLNRNAVQGTEDGLVADTINMKSKTDENESTTTAVVDTSFLGSRFGRRILNKLKIKLPLSSGEQTVGGRRSTKKHQEGTGGEDSTEDDSEVARFAAQFNDPTMKTSAQLAAEIKKEKKFIEVLASKGLIVVEIEGDGNCMFRAISHQLFLNEDQHEELRRKCVDHLIENKARFSMFCFDDFDQHIEHMSQVGVWGDELELRALEEIIDRPIRIFSSDAPDQGTPLSNNFEELELLNGVVPITLSYHGSNHYNSVNDSNNPLPLRMRNTNVLFQSRQSLFSPGPTAMTVNTDSSPISPSSVKQPPRGGGSVKLTTSASVKANPGKSIANSKPSNLTGTSSGTVKGMVNTINSSNTVEGQSAPTLAKKHSRKNVSSGASVVSTSNGSVHPRQSNTTQQPQQNQPQHYAPYQQVPSMAPGVPTPSSHPPLYPNNSGQAGPRNNQSNIPPTNGASLQQRYPHPSQHMSIQNPPTNNIQGHYNVPPPGYAGQPSPRANYPGSSSPSCQLINAYPSGPSVFTFQNGNLPPVAMPSPRQGRSSSISSPSSKTEPTYYPPNNVYR